MNSLPKPAFLNFAPQTCGTCEFHEATGNLAMIICRGVPPTPCIVGGQQTVRGPEYQIELLSPQMSRSAKGCALWRQNDAPIGEMN